MLANPSLLHCQDVRSNSAKDDSCSLDSGGTKKKNYRSVDPIAYMTKLNVARELRKTLRNRTSKLAQKKQY